MPPAWRNLFKVFLVYKEVKTGKIRDPKGNLKGKHPSKGQSKTLQPLRIQGFFLEVAPRFEPGNQGFADPCLTTWLCHRLHPIICELSQKVHTFFEKSQKNFPPSPPRAKQYGVFPWGPRRNPAKRFRWGSEGIPNIVQFSPKAETERCWEFLSWSGQRGSNSLPPPWQGGALPDELCPREQEVS